MKLLPSAARWFAVVFLLILPTFLRYEGSDASTLVCRRDGAHAGTCYAAPTLYQRVTGSAESVSPIPIADLGHATPGDGTIEVLSNNDCWHRHGRMHSFCRGTAFASWEFPTEHWATRAHAHDWKVDVQTADRLNDFLAHEERMTFRIERPTPVYVWHLLFYVAAAVVVCLNVRRALALRTTAWVRTVEAIPATALTPYRG